MIERISRKVLTKKRMISNHSVNTPVNQENKQTFFKQLDISSCQDLKPEQELSKILENQPEYTESKAW